MMCVFITNVCYPEHVLRGCVLQDMEKSRKTRQSDFFLLGSEGDL